MELSTAGQFLAKKSWVVLVRDFGSMIIISNLSQFSLRKLACIHDFLSVRQLIRIECSGVMDLVAM